MDELFTTSEVIEALGGNRPVADLTGSTHKAVSNWRGFPKFPANTYLAMTAALATIGKTAPASLWGMKARAEVASS
jgi:hypothetical protein